MPETPAAQARVLKQWDKWFSKLGPAVVDGGNPFSGAVNKIKADGTVAKGAVGQRASGAEEVEGIASSADELLVCEVQQHLGDNRVRAVALERRGPGAGDTAVPLAASEAAMFATWASVHSCCGSAPVVSQNWVSWY